VKEHGMGYQIYDIMLTLWRLELALKIEKRRRDVYRILQDRTMRRVDVAVVTQL
jgi:hypothetical protein